jgi:hypothetical protein
MGCLGLAESIDPEGAIWPRQTIRRDTPPDGFGAIVIWVQIATPKGGQPKSVKVFVVVDYWKVIEKIAIGEGLTAFALPHHRAYGSVHGGSSRLA